jgi:Protein of unknown function (DUF3592)
MTANTFEPELDQPLPRRVRARERYAYGCGLWFLRLFLLPHTLVGLWLIFKAASWILLSVCVLLAGQDVDGRIVRKVVTQGKKGPYYSADYVYPVDQIEYEGKVSLEANEYAAMREGQPITVKVFAPGVECGHWPGVASHSPLREVGGIVFGAVFWNGIMSIFVYMLYVRPWRQRWMVRRGLPTAGLVRQVQQWSNKGTKMVRIRYDYAVPAGGHTRGGVFSGKMTASGSQVNAVAIGEIVTVLYNPGRPHRSLVYALADYKAVPLTAGAA